MQDNGRCEECKYHDNVLGCVRYIELLGSDEETEGREVDKDDCCEEFVHWTTDDMTHS